VIDLLLVVVVKFVLDGKPVWLLEPGNHVQDVPLETG
jgi:hypothetical protein